MDKTTVLVIGDVAFDVFMAPQIGETLPQMRAEEKYICFPYGDKIPVEHLESFPGGNATNVSIGLQRLDIPSTILTTIGTDNISKVIFGELQHEDVGMEYVTVQAGISSNYSTIISYQGERTIFTYHAPKKYVYEKIDPLPPYIYLTSMGERFLPYYQELINHLIESPKIILMFNPGSLQKRAPIEDIHMVLKRTNILFVNREEAETFSEVSNSEGKEKEILQVLQKLGPKTVIMTDNEKGVYGTDGTHYVHMSIIPVTVLEKTGAGDSFNSGFIAAILKGLSFEKALQWGTMNAASVIGYVGAQKGLLHTKDIDSWSRMFDNAKVTTEEL